MNNYWIGTYENFQYEEWTWITDEEFLFNNWAYDEPNNYHNIIEGYGHIITGDYTSVNKYKTLGTWNDSSQDGAGYANTFFDLKNYGFICKIDNVNVNISDHDYSDKKVTVNGKFPFEMGTGGNSTTTDFYYRDSYFSEDSSSYNASLASMSISMALAGFGTPNSKDEPKNFNKNIVEVYNQIGFKDEYSCIYDFDKEEKLYNSHGNLLFYDASLSGPNSTDNSIGVHIAKKRIKINDKIKTLLSVVACK